MGENGMRNSPTFIRETTRRVCSDNDPHPIQFVWRDVSLDRLWQVFGENLTDTRAQVYANYWQWYKAITVSHPRTLGLRVSYFVRFACLPHNCLLHRLTR